MPKSSYEAHRDRQGDQQRQQSRSGRDIGPIPEIGNIRRRARCRNSLRFFCETYNPEAFSLEWSDDHLKAIARLEEAATRGALYAFAMPRGTGKSTLSRMAALWAISYGLCRYAFTIGANLSKAREAMQAIKTWVRFLPRYVEDFPEIAYPVTKLAGIAQRAVGQLSEGSPTLIEWGQDRVILPTVMPPPNWPKSWKLRDDGYVPTSGAAIAAAGLTSDGIRGSLLTLSTGETIRPDLVLLDDPQTPESAVSPAQNEKRERLISADVLGMAGPGRSISAVMPCTVIAPGDMVDRILTRSLHPLWRGERTKLLRKIPESLTHWDDYLEVYRRCAQKEPPDYSEANAYYQAHQQTIEAGCEASWQERKLPDEVSAIQHAIHLYARSPAAFFAEYQNTPLDRKAEDRGQLVADTIAGRVNRHDRGVAPSLASRVVAFVDVQGDLLYWLVCALADDYTGAVIDYGTYPEQGRPYFTLSDARPTLPQVVGISSVEGSVFAGLDRLADSLLTREWPVDGRSSGLRIERMLVDANWGQSTDTVYRWARHTAHAAVVTPSHGKAIGAGAAPMGEWQRQEGERRGLNWCLRQSRNRAGRYAIYDTNHWKTFTASRLLQPLGERGALSLFGDKPYVHRLLCDHLTAEYRVRTMGRGREVDEWSLRPERPDNHWLDCLVGCMVAASIQGAILAGTEKGSAPRQKERVSWSELQRQRKGQRR